LARRLHDADGRHYRNQTLHKMARGPACCAEFAFRLFWVGPSLNGQEII
jgi:hypothetical protein